MADDTNPYASLIPQKETPFYPATSRRPEITPMGVMPKQAATPEEPFSPYGPPTNLVETARQNREAMRALREREPGLYKERPDLAGSMMPFYKTLSEGAAGIKSPAETFMGTGYEAAMFVLANMLPSVFKGAASDVLGKSAPRVATVLPPKALPEPAITPEVVPELPTPRVAPQLPSPRPAELPMPYRPPIPPIIPREITPAAPSFLQPGGPPPKEPGNINPYMQLVTKKEEPPYSKAPDTLMGMAKEPGRQKGYGEHKYKYELPVKVTFEDGNFFYDAIRGLNKSHAMERARRNWEGASIEEIPKNPSYDPKNPLTGKYMIQIPIPEELGGGVDTAYMNDISPEAIEAKTNEVLDKYRNPPRREDYPLAAKAEPPAEMAAGVREKGAAEVPPPGVKPAEPGEIKQVPLTPESPGYLQPSTPPPKPPSEKPWSMDWKENIPDRPPDSRVKGKPWVGTPPLLNIDSQEKLNALRGNLSLVMSEGLPGKDFYKNTTDKTMEFFNNDPSQSKKLFKQFAVMSWNAPVEANVKWAATSFRGELEGKKWKAGMFPRQKEIARKLYHGEEGVENIGRKSDAFSGAMEYYLNPEEFIKSRKGKFPLPIDVWMKRVFGFLGAGKGTPPERQYDFMENETLRLARDSNMNPLEVQASLWLGGMARWNLAKPSVLDEMEILGIDPLTDEGEKYFNTHIYDAMMKVNHEDAAEWARTHVDDFSHIMDRTPFFQRMTVLHYKRTPTETIRGSATPEETRLYSREIRDRMDAGRDFPNDPRFQYRPEVNTYQSGTTTREAKIVSGTVPHSISIPEHLIYDLNKDPLGFKPKTRTIMEEKGQFGNIAAERNLYSNMIHDRGYLGYAAGAPGDNRVVFLFGDWKANQAQDFVGGVSPAVQGVTKPPESFDDIVSGMDENLGELVDYAHITKSKYYPEVNIVSSPPSIYQGLASGGEMEKSLSFRLSGPRESVLVFLSHLGLGRNQNSILMEPTSQDQVPSGIRALFKIKGSPEEARKKALTLGINDINMEQREDGTYVNHFIYAGDESSRAGLESELRKFLSLSKSNGESSADFHNSSASLVESSSYKKSFLDYFGSRGESIYEKVRKEGESYVRSKSKANPAKSVKGRGSKEVQNRSSGQPGVQRNPESPEESPNQTSEEVILPPTIISKSKGGSVLPPIFRGLP